MHGNAIPKQHLQMVESADPRPTGAVCVCTTLEHECRGSLPQEHAPHDSLQHEHEHEFYPIGFHEDSCRGVQHHWHTARNEAIANGGKESGTLDSVPAKGSPRRCLKIRKTAPVREIRRPATPYQFYMSMSGVAISACACLS